MRGKELTAMTDQTIKAKAEKKILDVTCGSRTIWFDKHHPAAVYCDIRDEDLYSVC